MKNITIGLLAHVDAGKTTLSEALLYRAGVIRTLGRVDHADAFLDTDAQERSRGITIFSKQAVIETAEERLTLLDTPGHVDFSAEMERALQVMDYAVLVISGADGVQAHTQTLWRLLRRSRIPTILFVNKMDLSGADRAQLMQALTDELDERCVDFTQPEAQLSEQLALCSEAAMEQYLENGALHRAELQTLVAERRVFPCFFGSALRLSGVDALLSALRALTRQPLYPAAFAGRVYKIARDEKGARLTFLKLTGGSLAVKAQVQGPGWEEKADQLRLYSGKKYTLLQSASAGELIAVTGLSRSMPGDLLGAEREQRKPVLQPVLEYRLQTPGTDEAAAYLQLRVLEEEDPLLHLVWDARLHQIRVQLMGPVQMEVLTRLLETRFGLSARFDAGQVVYRETILEPVEGVGHYEPLRHYAEVHLLLEPGEPGSGVQLDTMCPEDVLARNWQRLIFTHLAERQHPGVLTGSPLTDVRITLVAGRAHLKHTEGGDFRQATYRAVRQGLKKAKCVLLEPWYRFCITLPAANLGRAITDIQNMHGEFDAPETGADEAELRGCAPVRLLQTYQAELSSYTRGRGRLRLEPDGYRPCPEQEKIVRELGYDAERDLENPTGSVFCDHGAGFEVKWNEVDRYAHLPLLQLQQDAPAQPQRIVKSVAPGGAPELEKELLAIFERTYGAIRRRDLLPALALRSEDKRELLELVGPAEEYVLVDGYNMIFAWDELRELSRGGLDAARHVLMNMLCNYQAFRGCAVILVFDAYKVPQNLGAVEKYHNIYIVYTRHAETADQYIERVSYELRGRMRVRVATSDALEQLIIIGHGAQRVSAEAFHAEVQDVCRRISQTLAQNKRKND